MNPTKDRTYSSRRKALELLEKRDHTQPIESAVRQDEFWRNFYQNLHNGNLIPIISNTLRNNRIFDDAANDSDGNVVRDDIPVDEDLATLWAKNIGYPLHVDHLRLECPLARVAQFNYIANNADQEMAKRRYLSFLKESILTIAEDDTSVSDEVDALRDQIDDLSFADIVARLDYPRFDDQNKDPLRILAHFRLPIYVTTSYYDFMERALKAENIKNVRTQFCLWNMKEEQVDPEHRPDPGFVPSPECPLVYHLHGIEAYPSSLVLSEDDYMDYMLALAQDNNANRPLIPNYLREAIAQQPLLLLGYRLQDWDFRTLFRGVIEFQRAQLDFVRNSHVTKLINEGTKAT